jgi:hypothetical protein
MSTRITPTNDETLADFIARKAEVDELLTLLQDASANNFNAQPDEIHSGHVGNLIYAAEKLREIAALLNV